MLHPSTQKLIDRLAEMTATKKIDWAEHENGGVSYATEGYSVVLTEAPVELVIFSSAEKELERATVDQLMATPVSDGGTYSDLVTGMHAEALRFARGTETAISTLLNQLEAPAEQSAATEADPVVDELTEESASQLLEDQADDSDLLQMEPFAELVELTDESEADLTADTDSMTAAVARLADEVNEREDLAAANEPDEPAAETPVEEVQDIAVSEQADDDQNEPQIAVAEETIVDPAAADDISKFSYIPFGLTSEAELPVEPEASIVEAASGQIELEDQTSERQTGFTPTVISPIANDDEPQTQIEDKPTDLAGITASALNQADDDTTMSSPTVTSFAGIGAGTGLLRPAASDVETAAESEPEAAEPDPVDSGRFVIDATEDFVDFDPSDEAEDAAPDDGSARERSNAAQDEEPADAQVDDEAADPVEPERPRFNPWN